MALYKFNIKSVLPSEVAKMLSLFSRCSHNCPSDTLETCFIPVQIKQKLNKLWEVQHFFWNVNTSWGNIKRLLCFFPLRCSITLDYNKKINEKWDFLNIISSPKIKERHKETQRDDRERMGKGGRESERDKGASWT